MISESLAFILAMLSVALMCTVISLFVSKNITTDLDETDIAKMLWQ